jgi:hypothetical protein
VHFRVDKDQYSECIERSKREYGITAPEMLRIVIKAFLEDRLVILDKRKTKRGSTK